MPIYESGGKKYNIPDNKVDSFIKEKQDAKLIDKIPYHLTPQKSNIPDQQDDQSEISQGNEGKTIPPLPEFSFQSKIGGAGMTPENYQFKGNTFDDAGKKAAEEFAKNPELLKHKRTTEGFWNSYIGDTLEKIGAGAVGAEKNTLGLLAKAGNLLSDDSVTGATARTVAGPLASILGAVSKDKLQQGSDALKGIEHKLDERSARYGDENFVDLYKKGDYSGMVGDVFLQASRSLPQSLMAAFTGPIGVASIGLTSANEKYDQLDQNADLSEVQKISSAILTGSFEALSEYIGSVPIGKWLKSVYEYAGKDAAKNQLQKGVSGWMQNQFKKHGLLLAPIGEGLEEFASQIATNVTDKTLGIDPEIGIMDGVFESFVYGAGGGAQFSAAAVPGLIKNAHERRKIKNNYKSSREEFINSFSNPDEANETLAVLDEVLEKSDHADLQNIFANISRDQEITDEQRIKLVNYAIVKRSHSAIFKAESDEIAQVQQEAAEVIQSNVNPDMGAVVSVQLGGVDNPVQVVKGNIVQFEDGSIDKDNSSQEIYYKDENGETKVAPIAHIEGLSEVIPTDEAIAQAGMELSAPILARQENDEVRPYEIGEPVSALFGNGLPRFGQIAEINEDGTYTFIDKETMQEYFIEPREIINEDHLVGIDQGSEVSYKDEKGKIQTGIVEDMYNFRNEGAIMINGDKIPVANVQGLSANNVSENNPHNEAGPVNEQNNVSEVAPEVQEEAAQVPFIDQIPKDEKGNMLFEQAPVESTIGALKEVYEDENELSSVVHATIEKIQKQIEKAKSPKPTGDINKDIANKQASRQTIADLNNRLSYWNSLKDAVVPPAQETVKQEEPKQRTFGERLEAAGNDISSLRDMILHGIASGSYKFNWKGNENTPGAAKELGLSESEAERRSRINILSNVGHTPETLAHHIWEETDGRFDIDDIRNEIIDVLSSINSRTSALNELESRQTDNSEAYWQEQADAYEYEQEMLRQEYDVISEIMEQLNEEELLSLISQAELEGATIEQINETVTATDIIDLLEQLQYEQQQRDQQTSNEGRDREQIPESDGKGYSTSTTERTVSERNGSAEDSRNQNENQSSEQNGLNSVRDSYEALAKELSSVAVNASPTVIAEDPEDFINKLVEAGASEKLLQSARGSLATKDGCSLLGGYIQPLGKVYLIKDRINDPAEFAIVWLHENIHSALDKVLGKNKIKILSELYNDLGKDAILQYVPERYFKEDEIDELAEEYIARLSEDVTKNKDILSYLRNRDFSDIPSGIHSLEILKELFNYLINSKDVRYNDTLSKQDSPDSGNEYSERNEGRTSWDNGQKDHSARINPDRGGNANDVHPVQKQSSDVSRGSITGGNANVSQHGEQSEGTVLDDVSAKQKEIAQAEAETNTNPTEAQKEAGNYKKGKVTIQGFDISIEQPKGSTRSGKDASGKEWSVTMNNTYGYIRKTEGKDGDHIDVFIGPNPDSTSVFVVDQVKGYKKGEVITENSIDLEKSGIEDGFGEHSKITIIEYRGENSDGVLVATVRVIGTKENPFVETFEVFLKKTASFDEHKVMLGFDSLEEAREAYLSNYEEGWQGLGNITQVDVETFRKWTESDTRRIKPFAEYKEIQNAPVPAYGSTNTLITTDRYEELKKQMRNKLNNLNVGFDPEILTLGSQMAMYHIESGARKFSDFASKMVEDLGDSVRPYLKSFYEAARHMPGMEVHRDKMDAFKTVNAFDVDNIGKNVENKKDNENADTQQLSIFDETTNTQNNETDSNERSNDSPAENGRVSTGTIDSDVRKRAASTETTDRDQGEQRTSMETESVSERGRSERSTGDHAEPTRTKLHTGESDRNGDNGRKDRRDSGKTEKPLNNNNNRQSRDEDVVPKGNAAKINANIAAIKLAKKLIESGKKATPEQMNVLRKYTGWGGLSSVFQENDKNYQALKDVLTEDEYDSARASTTTAFYTPTEITASVWDMIEKLGFKGGNILEPSAGIGNFFALMPESISKASHLRGVELDTVSGSILKLLYPDANINISGFEKQRIANNSIDLVVSNVPFGNFKVYDSNNKDISNFDIHDYFIAKSVRALKAGGIGVFITTSSTLDKSAALRSWVINNGNADFIDAVRLNTNTFKNDSGTEATADIIIIRKRDAKGISPYANNMQDSVVAREETYMQQVKDRWGNNAGEVEKNARMVYNKYFQDNPHRLSGEMKFGFEGGNAIRPTEQRLASVSGIDQKQIIDQLINDLPADIYNSVPAERTSTAVANNGTKEGGLTIIDGKAYLVSYNTAVPVDWNTNKVAGYTKVEALQDYLDIKNAIDELLNSENSGVSDANIKTWRAELNKTYDNFVKKYGYLNENRKINFLQDDVDFSSVSAIENVEDNYLTGEKTITKSDIFSKRVIDKQIDPKADNVTDAVRVSLNQNGKIDIPYIAELLNKTEQEVQAEIIKERIGFLNPETGIVEGRDNYLSGNVREKLSLADQANQEGEYDSNIEELSKVIPADIPINLIKMTLGSTWIPNKMYEAFFKENFEVTATITKTSTDKYIGKFSNEGNAKDRQMGMTKAYASTLALNAMNNTTTTITMSEWRNGRRATVTDPVATAQAGVKQTELSDLFESWMKQKKDNHEELENIYNNTFNAIVNTKVDASSFDRFPGAGGKVVSLGNETLENGTELFKYRVAKENTDNDNATVAKEAAALGLDYDKESGIYSTANSKNAHKFFKSANGDSKILREHQKEGVIRALQGATLFAHEVGTGKTLTLITSAMEMRRLGLAKKPCIVVQRSTYKQFVKEIKNQYPNAKVLAPASKDLTAKQREQLFAKVAYNDWDIVVLYHSYLDSIPDDPQRVANYIDERIQEKMELLEEVERAKEEGSPNAGRMAGAIKKEIQRLEREKSNALYEDDQDSGKSKRKRSVKDIEKVRANAESHAEKALDRRTDNTMTFEQLGIDALMVDEAHAYKKLGFVTSLQRVKGIDTAESKRAQSTRLKSSYILENHNGKNVVFATGTPISNTMAEMWTFMRFLLPKSEMSRLQMNSFDAFVNNFGSIEESAEFGTNGKFRITNRFASYSNVPELIAAWRQVAHTVLTEEISTLREGVGTPRLEGGKPTDIMIQQTPPLKSVMKAIKQKLEEFENMSGAQKKENSHIPLVMFGLAKRAAIDVRLVDPNLPDDTNSKTNITVAEILKDLKETESYKGTNAIFCDNYQSSDKKFNVFQDIKQKLIDNGIPAEQIAIINDYDKDDAKEKLFALINNGTVRVVMGTTEKLGVGVNIQERLHMLSHMDAPIRPSDYQQRNGRIARQGNTHLNMDKTIKILRVGVQKTLDVTGYQRLEIKKKFIDQIMKGDVSQRMLEEADIDSTDSANFNQMMANLSGSQAALALSIENNKLKKLENAKQYHEDNQIFISGAVKRARGVIVGNGQAIERFEKYREDINKLFPEKKITSVSIGKVSGNTPDEIDFILNKHITNKIEEEVEALRSDFVRDNAKMKLSLSVNDVKIDLDIEVKRNYDIDSKKTRITRNIKYLTPDKTTDNPNASGEKMPLFEGNAGANITNMLNDINDLLSGYDIDRAIQKYRIGLDKAHREIETYEPQIGQNFPKEKELEATIRRVEELNVQMLAELKQIEEEESKEVIEVINIDNALEKTDEDPDDDPSSPKGRRQSRSSSSSFSTISAQKFNSLVDKLNATGLAVDVVIDDDIRSNPEIKDAQGNVYGYVTSDGVIHLDAHNMNANTPIHEFGHLWNSIIKENNPELWNKGAELIKQSEYWQRVNNNPEYSSLSEDQKIDEALAWAIGDKGEAVWNNQKNLMLFARVKGWLHEVWTSIKKMFGITGQLNIDNITLSDFTDMAVNDLLGGEKLTNDKNETEGKVRYQSVSDIADETGSSMTEKTRKELDKKLKNLTFKLREAWEDRYLAVKEFQDLLMEKGVDIAEYNDFYKQATHIQGKNDAQLEVYNKHFQRPVNEAISALEKAGLPYRSIENYAIFKHGLERNEWMRQEKINEFKKAMPEATPEQIDAYIESLPDDFSGITAVQEEVGMSAEEFISEFEKKADSELINNLWKHVKNATKFALNKELEGGLITKQMHDELSVRYDYYIPLRGHDAETAEDRWDYSPIMGTYFVAPLLKAKGRKTRSESPFAYISQMAQSAITASNKNLLNQTVLRLARKDKTGLMTVSRSWYELIGENDEGQPIYEMRSPMYSENPDQYRENIEKFEERMDQLSKEGLAVQKSGKLNIGGLFIKPKQAEQHEIPVMQNGTEYVVYINANPAVSRAINGINAKDLHKDLQFIANVSRQMSANFTTRNPIFVASNFSRDFIFASSILPVKEGVGYAMKFQKNMPKAAGALQRYLRGKGDMSNKYDNYVVEYIMNGARTGFSHIVELQKIQKQIEREVKNGGKQNAVRKLLDALSSCNEFAENLSRLSVYITSREQGRSIVESVSNAKEVTVNFNRSGAGGYASQWIRPLFLFVNAGIQALSNFAKVAQKNPGKTAALVASYAATGFIVPILCNLIGGDDGLDEYLKLSDWERQNNLCIYTGDGFVKIPLPHELRVFHKMGDEIYQATFGEKDVLQSLLDVTLGFADLIPANPMGAIQGSWAEVLPDGIKPLAQLAANTSFTGSPITKENQSEHKPGYLRVRTNKRGEAFAPSFLVKLSETIDKATGGDGVERGLISFNPDVLNHVLRGYFGGLYTMTSQGLDIASKTYDWSQTGEFKLKVRETPLRAFYTSSADLQTSSSGLNSRYYKVTNETKEVGRKLKGYQEQVKDGELGIDGFYKKIKNIDIEKHNALKSWIKEIDKYETALKDMKPEEQSQAEKIISDYKKTVLEIHYQN